MFFISFSLDKNGSLHGEDNPVSLKNKAKSLIRCFNCTLVLQSETGCTHDALKD